MSKPPLFDLFCHLRDTGDFPLTIEQYNLLLQALDNGFALNSREDLKNICFMLWIKAKPNSELAQKFSQYFDDYFYRLEVKMKEEIQELIETDIPNLDIQNQEPQKIEIPKSEPTKPETTKPEIQKTETIKPEPTKPETPKSETPKSEPIPEFLQPPIALQGGMLPQNKFIPKSKFQLSIRDFPLTERKIQRSWSYLRLPVQQGHLIEIDADATVEKFLKTGFLLDRVC